MRIEESHRPDQQTNRRETTMRYALLIHAEETRYAEMSPQETAQLRADHAAFTGELE